MSILRAFLFLRSKNSATCGENFTDDILKTARWILMGPTLFFISHSSLQHIQNLKKIREGELHYVVVL